MSTFGERLKSSRYRANLKQRELADKTKSHFNTIGAYENDKIEPSLSKIQSVAEALNEDFVWLATGETLAEYILRRQGQYNKDAQSEKRRATDHIPNLNPIMAGLMEVDDGVREIIRGIVDLYVKQGKEK